MMIPDDFMSQRKNITRRVYGVILFIIVIIIVFLFLLRLHISKINQWDEIINDYHLVASHNSLQLQSTINNFRLWAILREGNGKSIDDKEEVQLSPFRSNISIQEKLKRFNGQINDLVTIIVSLQARYQKPEFIMLSSMLDKENLKLQLIIDEFLTLDNFSSHKVEFVVAPLFAVSHQLHRLHDIAYLDMRSSLQGFIIKNRMEISLFVLLLLIAGLFSIYKMMRYIRHNLSELSQIQNDLKQERDFSSGLIKTAPVIVLLLDADGYILHANPFFEHLIGYSLEQIKGKNCFSSLLPDHDTTTAEEMFPTIKQHPPYEGNIKVIVTAEGAEREIEWFSSVIKDDNGHITGVLSVGHDITERKKIDEALKQSELQLAKAQQIAKIGHWSIDVSTQTTSGSAELYRIFGLPLNESERISFINLIHPEDREMSLILTKRAVDYGENFDFEYRIICPDNSKKWVHVIGEAVTDDHNKVIQLMGTIQDITKQRKAEFEGEQSRARFQAVFESIPDAIIYVDTEWNMRLVNNATSSMFGYKKSELIGHQTEMLYAETKKHKQPLHFISDNDITHSTIKITYRSKQGHEFIGETTATPVRSIDGEIQGYLGVIRDVSERTHVEAILKSLASGVSSLEFEPFMDSVLERLTELYGCEYALIGRVKAGEKYIQTLAVRADGKAVENFEYGLKGTPCQQVLERKKELIINNVRELFPYDQLLIDQGVNSYFGAPLVTLNGSLIGIISVMCTHPMILDEWTEPVLGVFANRVSLELEREIAATELERYREHLEELVDNRTTELTTARDEAERANVAKSEFLSRMSHELRTPLNAILGFGQMLEMDAEGFNDTQQENISEILQAGSHLLSLINEVLDLSRVESGKIEFNLEEILIDDPLQQCIDLLQPLLEKRQLVLEDKVSGNGFVVKADLIRLKQVLLNLLSNATKYNKFRGSITISSEVINQQWLRINISDAGNGLSQQEIEKLFQPFERLKSVHNVEGTGIGLVITKQLVELMGGKLGIKSKPGEGSTFWIELLLQQIV